MKRILLSSLLIAFLCFFIGIGLIIYASGTLNITFMYAGLVLLILGALGYTILGFVFFFQWYKSKRSV